jgi:cytochrome c-type biogenesis protein CcmH
MNPFWSVSLFWIAAVAFVALALAFVLPPLLRRRAAADTPARRDINIAVYRDQLKELEAERASGALAEEQFNAARLELEARLAEDALLQDATPVAPRADGRKIGYALAALLPIAAFALYFWLGNPMSLMAIAEAGHNATPAAGEHDIAAMLKKIEDHVRAKPDDGKAWAMLGKTYAALDRWGDAAKAYERAVKLLPKEAAVLSGYAEALAIVNDRNLKGEPMAWVEKALELDPNDVKALELSAVHAFQEKNFAQAAYYFKRLYKLLPPETPYAQDILAAQKEAMRRAEGGAAASEPEAPAAAANPAARITGTVDIAPALKAALSGKEPVFLFARPGASGPPVAALRTTVDQLPLAFELNDAMAMMPDSRLSQHKAVMLVARVSKTGNPVPQPGDFEGSVADVKVGASGVKIVIDHARP